MVRLVREVHDGIEMKPIAILAILLSFVAQSPAKVLIYKGTLRSISDSNTALSRTFTVFDIFDPDKSLLASIVALQADGKKLLLVSSPTDIRFTQAPLRNGRTASIVSMAFVNGGSNDFFEHVTIRFRGTNKPLRFNSQIAENFVTFPRLLTGTVFDDEAFNGAGAFIEQKTAIVYQENRTVTANDANQTAQQAVDGLVAELKVKGFELPAP
jgi:hypothetical protein